MSRNPERARGAIQQIVLANARLQHPDDRADGLTEEILAIAVATRTSTGYGIKRDRSLTSWVRELVRRSSLRSGPTATYGEAAGWDDMAAAAIETARAWCRHHGVESQEAADLAQEGILRMLEAAARGRTIRSPRAWWWTVFTNMEADAARRGCGGPLPPPRESVYGLEPPGDVRSRDPSPVDLALSRESGTIGRSILAELPAPYREILCLEYLHGVGRSQVVERLRQWRPVGDEAIKKLIRQAHQMLRALRNGSPPRQRWPGRYIAGKNPWIGTPPPLILRLFG